MSQLSLKELKRQRVRARAIARAQRFPFVANDPAFENSALSWREYVAVFFYYAVENNLGAEEFKWYLRDCPIHGYKLQVSMFRAFAARDRRRAEAAP